jgi:hypothetical protein
LLPCPPSLPFNVTIRVYQPRKPLLDGTYKLPTLQYGFHNRRRSIIRLMRISDGNRPLPMPIRTCSRQRAWSWPTILIIARPIGTARFASTARACR